MSEIILGIVAAVYLVCAYQSLEYIKVHIMGITAEYCSDTIAFYGKRLIWAAALGWMTIPLAFIHKTSIAK